MWVLEGAATQGHWVSLKPRDPTVTGSDVHHPSPFCRGLLAHLTPNETCPHLLSTYYVLGQRVQFNACNAIFAVCVVPCTSVCTRHLPCAKGPCKRWCPGWEMISLGPAACVTREGSCPLHKLEPSAPPLHPATRCSCFKTQFCLLQKLTLLFSPGLCSLSSEAHASLPGLTQVPYPPPPFPRM